MGKTISTPKPGRYSPDRLPDSMWARTNVDDETGCWVHSTGCNGQTRVGGVVSRVGRFVWDIYYPDDQCYISEKTGDPMTDSIRPADDCHPRCINPLHLNKMSSSERMHLARDNVRHSDYIGVVWNESAQKWTCRVYFEGECYTGPYVTDERDAAIRFDQMVTALAPERPTNYSTGRLRVKPTAVPPTPPREHTSKHKGVFLHKDKWYARYYHGGGEGVTHIGRFATEKEAVAAVEKFAETI